MQGSEGALAFVTHTYCTNIAKINNDKRGVLFVVYGLGNR